MLLALWATPFTLHADETTDYHQAWAWFDQALDDKDGALEKSITQFSQLHNDNPDHPVYRAYLGACKTLQGRDAWMPWNKMRHTEQGLDQIDKALDSLNPKHDSIKIQGVPLYLETMLVAANTFIQVPDSIFHRHAKGIRLLGKIKIHPAYAKTPDGFKAAVQQALKKAQVGDS